MDGAVASGIGSTNNWDKLGHIGSLGCREYIL